MAPTGSGQYDADVRFLLANERTLLAWVRTSLTLQAGGVALTQVPRSHWALRMFGIALVAIGLVAAVIGYRRWRAADRAIRSGSWPPVGRGPIALTTGTVVLAFLLIVLLTVTLR